MKDRILYQDGSFAYLLSLGGVDLDTEQDFESAKYMMKYQ